MILSGSHSSVSHTMQSSHPQVGSVVVVVVVEVKDRLVEVAELVEVVSDVVVDEDVVLELDFDELVVIVLVEIVEDVNEVLVVVSVMLLVLALVVVETEEEDKDVKVNDDETLVKDKLELEDSVVAVYDV